MLGNKQRFAVVSDKNGQNAFVQHRLFYRWSSFAINSFFSTQILAKTANYIKRISLLWGEGKFNGGILL